MATGPVIAAVTGVPGGHLVDRFGAQRMTICGLIGMAVGCVSLLLVPASWGVAGYIAPLIVIKPLMRCSRRPTMPPS